MKNIKTYNQFSNSEKINEEEDLKKWLAGAALVSNIILGGHAAQASQKTSPQISTSMNVKTGNEDSSELLKNLPETFETKGDFNESLALKNADRTVRVLLAEAKTGSTNFNTNQSGMDPNDFYDMKMFKSENGTYKVIGVRRDAIGQDVDASKWNKLLGNEDTKTNTETEQSGETIKRFKSFSEFGDKLREKTNKFKQNVKDKTQEIKNQAKEKSDEIKTKLNLNF